MKIEFTYFEWQGKFRLIITDDTALSFDTADMMNALKMNYDDLNKMIRKYKGITRGGGAYFKRRSCVESFIDFINAYVIMDKLVN